MNKTEILERINKVAERRDTEAKRKADDAHAQLMKKVNAIKALAPRIANMLDIAQSLWENKIRIGKPITEALGMTRSDLTTDGINHTMGFYTDRKKVWGEHWLSTECGYPYAFGIEGGGYSGYGLEIDRNGNIVRGMPNRYGTAEDKMQWVIDHFDEFERKFYAYVESL